MYLLQCDLYIDSYSSVIVCVDTYSSGISCVDTYSSVIYILTPTPV